MKFNPFKKPIGKLVAQDLQVLRDVSEGWYVEYKRQLPNNASISKSITSFANTYGGWLFYGINEAKDNSRKASEFPGIEDAVDAEVHVREAMVYHSNPEPYFETHIVEGPCTQIGLIEGKSILIVYIPKSNSLPHVHGSGRIYRRVSDSSEPIAEKDRARLDAMWEQKRNSHKRLASFFETALPPVGEEMTALHMFIMSDPLGTKGHRSSMEFDKFSSIMRDVQMPFDNFFSGSNRYVARMTRNNDINQPLFTWQYFDNGTSVVTIPIPSIGLCSNNLTESSHFFSGYEFGDHFLDICDKAGKNTGVIIDLSQLCMVLAGIIKRHNTLLSADGVSSTIYIKACGQNLKNRIPFIDSLSVIQFIQKNGLPYPHSNEFYYPDGDDINLFHSLKDYPKQTEEFIGFANAALLFSSLLPCFGLPQKALFKDGEDVKEGNIRLIDELSLMHKRSPRTKRVKE